MMMYDSKLLATCCYFLTSCYLESKFLAKLVTQGEGREQNVREFLADDNEFVERDNAITVLVSLCHDRLGLSHDFLVTACHVVGLCAGYNCVSKQAKCKAGTATPQHIPSGS